MNKETLELKKEVLRLDKKWTKIWLTTIFAYVLLTIISLCFGCYPLAFGFSLSTLCSLLFLKSHELDIKDQMTNIKMLEALDQRIEELEQKIKKFNHHE